MALLCRKGFGSLELLVLIGTTIVREGATRDLEVSQLVESKFHDISKDGGNVAARSATLRYKRPELHPLCLPQQPPFQFFGDLDIGVTIPLATLLPDTWTTNIEKDHVALNGPAVFF